MDQVCVRFLPSHHLLIGLASVRNQERTGTLPLLVLEYVKDYQRRLENLSAEDGFDVETVLQCELSCQLPPDSSMSTYSPTTEDMVEGMLQTLEDVVDKGTSKGPTAAKWQQQNASAEHTPESAQPDEDVTLVEVIRAIRDAQYPQVKTAHERSTSSTLPQTPTAKDGDSIYRPFRTPSSSSFMYESGTPTGPSTPGVDSAATPPRTPFSPISAVTTPGAAVQTVNARTRDSADWTDFAETGFGETKTVPKPFVLGDAFRELRIREEKGDRSTVHSRGVGELGLGRPRIHPRIKAYVAKYGVESCGTEKIASTFIDSVRDARLAGMTHKWPHFSVLHLGVETARRFNLCSQYLLITLKLVVPERPEPETPPISSETPQTTVSTPLPTASPAPHTVTVPSTSLVPDTEKKNRRRSFFRSFSGSSSKNRKASSPSISSPMESPLPAVVEKREPLPTVQIASVREPPSTPIQIQAPQSSKLSPSVASNPSSSRSRASSVNRKPVPAIDEAEMQVLEAEARASETRASMGDASFVTANEETQFSPRPMADSGRLPLSPPHTTFDLNLEGSEEIISTDSPPTSLSATDNSDVAKSPHRRRRSGAPSPASVAHIGGDLPETADAAERIEESASEQNEGLTVAKEETFPAAMSEPLGKNDGTISESICTLEAPPVSTEGGSLEAKASALAQPADSYKAPVSLGAVL